MKGQHSNSIAAIVMFSVWQWPRLTLLSQNSLCACACAACHDHARHDVCVHDELIAHAQTACADVMGALILLWPVDFIYACCRQYTTKLGTGKRLSTAAVPRHSFLSADRHTTCQLACKPTVPGCEWQQLPWPTPCRTQLNESAAAAHSEWQCLHWPAAICLGVTLSLSFTPCSV